MLEVGNGGMTEVEYRSHFSLWAILAAPLIAGNDLRTMRPEIHDILTNKEVIAVDQDTLGRQGERVAKNGDLEVWAKQLKDGSRAVVLSQRGQCFCA
jgi:alpha-galactosidase